METNNIREAILKKAKGEADQILADAERKVQDMIAQSNEQKKQLFEDEKKKIIINAQRESAKILAQASLKERQTILIEKDAVIKDILAQVKEKLVGSAMETETIGTLLKEALDALETTDKIRLLVAPKDVASVQAFVEGHDALKEQIAEVKEKELLGGVMAETLDGMISIDNTYTMRLDMLIPKILPEIGKTLFGS